MIQKRILAEICLSCICCRYSKSSSDRDEEKGSKQQQNKRMAHTMMLYVRVACSATTAKISKTIVAVSAGIALLGMRHAECEPDGYGKQHSDEEDPS